MDVNATLTALIEHYGDGSDGTAPTPAQWRRILGRDPALPFALVNFFKFKAEAAYGASDEPARSGDEAFQRYAEVSLPAMQAAGGAFLAVAPYAGAFVGAEQDWDLVAIGKYPNLRAFMALHENPDYIRAYRHRKAALARQSVLAIEQ